MPPRTRQPSRRGLAIALAIAVHAVFIGVLVFSVRWQNRPVEAVTAELYTPQANPPVVEPPPPPPPKVEPPKPPPKVEPPKPPPPKVERPDPRQAEIALKAKQEQEKKKREQLEAQKKEAEKKAAEKREREEAEKKKLQERRLAEAIERQQREAEALKAQAEREREEAERERQAQRERQLKLEAQLREQAKAEAEASRRAAASRAAAEYHDRIRQKILGNVILPPDIAGNPEAIFDVVQLPTGEIIEITLRKSSGVRAYDEAVQRAILKSSPLPRPPSPELFQRVLNLRFRPRD